MSGAPGASTQPPPGQPDLLTSLLSNNNYCIAVSVASFLPGPVFRAGVSLAWDPLVFLSPRGTGSACSCSGACCLPSPDLAPVEIRTCFTCHPNLHPDAEKARWRCCGVRSEERGRPLPRPLPCAAISQRVGPHSPHLQRHLPLFLLVRPRVPKVTRAACVGRRETVVTCRAACVSGRKHPLSLGEQYQVWAGSAGLWWQLQWRAGGRIKSSRPMRAI